MDESNLEYLGIPVSLNNSSVLDFKQRSSVHCKYIL